MAREARGVVLGGVGGPPKMSKLKKVPLGEGPVERESGTCIHSQSLGSLHQVRQPAPRLAHQDGRGQSHAALPRCPEGCTHQLVQSVLLVGIGHHHAMVLGSLKANEKRSTPPPPPLDFRHYDN